MSDSTDFTLLENRLREPFLRMVKKYGRQKFSLWMTWTYMLWRSTNREFCVPEEFVLADLEMNKKTLPRLRNILIKEGWLRRDMLRDQGGKWLTRAWVITSPLPLEAYVDSRGDSGSYSVSVSSSVSPSPSHTGTLSDTNSDFPEVRREGHVSHKSKDGGKPENLKPQVKTCKNCGAVLLRNKGCACWTITPVEDELDDMDRPLDDWEKL